MIRAHFGLDKTPFDGQEVSLLTQQQEVLDTLRVHCQQGGLCVVVGEPGTGKSVIKEALCQHDPKRLITAVVNRTLHTYASTVRLLCEAFQIDSSAKSVSCEKRLIEQAFKVGHQGKMLAIIIDDAHLMDVTSLRRLRLLLEDFPKNHNLILVAQPQLITTLALTVHEDIKSRITYSVLIKTLTPDDIETFLFDQLDRVALPHNTFTPEAISLITRSAEGKLRAAKNLCIASMLEAVRDQTRIVDLKQVNRVLLQPHWARAADFQV